MDMDIARLWLQILNMAGTCGIGAWMYLEKRSDKTNARVDALTDRVEQADQALARIEGAAHGSLRYDDLQKVYDRLNAMDGKLNQLVGEFRGNNDTLRLLLNKITEKGLQ